MPRPRRARGSGITFANRLRNPGPDDPARVSPGRETPTSEARMSTAPVTEPRARRAAPREVRLYMRSWLLYWWPVWAVGFLMAGWTALDNRHMALVPERAVVQGNTLTTPEGSAPLLTAVHVSASKTPGIVFALTLLAVLAFGNGWLSGWRALTFAATVAAVLLLWSWLDWWGVLARWAAYLHVYINLGGYLVLSTGLLALWLVQFFVADRLAYVVFSLSQLRMHYAIGEEERAYDAGGVSFEKAPYDWFRWVVGFGAGDLRVRVGGQLIEIPNVIHVGRRLAAIETLLRTKDVE
jgi:hypothetical protein